MSKRRSKNPLSGCLSGGLLLVVAGGLLSYATSAPVSGAGGALVAPWLFWLVLMAGAAFLIGVVRGRVGLVGILIAIAIGAGLIFINGTDAMPLVDNPCPNDEVTVVVNGQCRGMDADANRAWLERLLGGGGGGL